MNNDIRKKVFYKYNGRCAYCGCELKKGWHVDHIEPVDRNRNGKMRSSNNDTLENYNPSCPECNRRKGISSLESLRIAITDFVQKSPQFAIAKKYGMIDNINPVVFYFERVGKTF